MKYYQITVTVITTVE